MKYKILRTDGDYDFHNDSAITELPKGAIALTDREWENRLQPSENQLFQSAKTAKIVQLKLNRDKANMLNMVSHQAYETKQIGELEFEETQNLVYFRFNTGPTGIPSTEAPTVINNILVRQDKAFKIRYSAKIIEGDTIRSGYVMIDYDLALNISNHSILRIQDNTTHCNNIEKDINACTTIEELNSINIEF